MRLLRGSSVVFCLAPCSGGLLGHAVGAGGLCFFSANLITCLAECDSPRVLLGNSVGNTVLRGCIMSRVHGACLGSKERYCLGCCHGGRGGRVSLVVRGSKLLRPLRVGGTSAPALSVIDKFSILGGTTVPANVNKMVYLGRGFATLSGSALIVPM